MSQRRTFDAMLKDYSKVRVKIEQRIKLHGVPGFVLHESILPISEKWSVSYEPLGVRAGAGDTVSAAIYDAEKRSKNRDVLLKEIKKETRKLKRIKEKK